MSDNLIITLIDTSGNSIETTNLEKPKTYQDLLNSLKNNLKNLPKYFIIFYKSTDDTEIEIHSNEEYKLSPNILYIHKIEKIDLTQSVFTRNFNKLPENKKDLLSDKYSCLICLNLIKEENPYYCYICQKNFHNKCLESWGKEKKLRHKTLSCPNCRHELPIEQWKNNINYEKNRRNEIEIINELNKNTISFNKYKEKTSNIFKGILYRLNEMHLRIKPEINEKLLNLTNSLSSDLKNSSLKDISTSIDDELNELKEFIKTKNKINNEKYYSNEIILIYENTYHDNREIRLFGSKFVENNKKNIELIIDGERHSLCESFPLKKGLNTIKMRIKNKITNLQDMFQYCSYLKELDLKNLDTKDVTNFSNMFPLYHLPSLKSLENWDVSKGKDFSDMFRGSNIRDIKFLKNWDVSNCLDFSYMFADCKELSDITPLKNWNVSNCNNFSYIFANCPELSDITALKKWNVSNGNNFSYMFSFCKKIKDVSPLTNWNVSRAKTFSYMFQNCESITSVLSLKNWDVSYCTNFSYMFESCKSLINILGLKSWNVSNGTNFSGMFSVCESIKDANPIIKWNVSRGTNFRYMFSRCESLNNIDILKKLKFSRKDYYLSMFDNQTLKRFHLHHKILGHDYN